MAVATGEVVQVTFRYNLQDQVCENVVNFRDRSVHTDADYLDAAPSTSRSGHRSTVIRSEATEGTRSNAPARQ
jgi:hypothetical protein